MTSLVLRTATHDDQALLEAWDEEPHVKAAGGAEEYVPGETWWDWAAELTLDPPWRKLLIAEVGGRPIGVVQIIDPALEETRYWGEACPPNLRAIDIWIGPADALGQGFGSQMMRQALALCFADAEVEAVLIDPLAANTRAQSFYARFGFDIVGPRRFGEDDCLVMRIDRERWTALAHTQR